MPAIAKPTLRRQPLDFDESKTANIEPINRRSEVTNPR
jgi:hypothetical protein